MKVRDELSGQAFKVAGTSIARVVKGTVSRSSFATSETIRQMQATGANTDVWARVRRPGCVNAVWLPVTVLP